MHEHQHRVGKHFGERVEREHVFRRFQNPASRRFARALEMAEEPRKEPVALVVAGRVEPRSIGRGAVDIVEARAAKHLARKLDALLRRIGLNRVQVPDPGREPVKNLELQLHHSASRAEIGRPMLGIGIDRLPYARRAVGGILRQQSVQERRAAARQAGDEDRRRERPRQDCRILALRVREDQKRREHPLEVPARREASERRQRRLFLETGGQGGERFDEARVGERLGVEARGLRRLGDQRLRREPRSRRRRKERRRAGSFPRHHSAASAERPARSWLRPRA